MSPTFLEQSKIRKMPREELSKRITYVFFTENVFLLLVFCFVFTAQSQIQIKFITPEFAMETKHLL